MESSSKTESDNDMFSGGGAKKLHTSSSDNFREDKKTTSLALLDTVKQVCPHPVVSHWNCATKQLF